MGEETRPSLPPGTVIAGKYRIEAKIGDGGMGVVYEAVHQRLRHRVAIKMLLPSLAVHPELVERFEREARAAATIESPNVAKVIDVDFTPEGTPYMVIEFLQGHDLAAELEKKVRLSIEEAVSHVLTACAPIAEAHALGIVHRDLKPSNLFLARKGNFYVLKVLDFGIAKVFSDGNAKITSSMFGLGTPHYMSPEQIRRSSNVDGRSDIWSLGVILYELLTGTVPFPNEPSAAIAAIAADPITPPRELRPDIPAELEKVVMKALEKDRERRYATARDFATDLAPFAGEEELVAVSSPQAMPRVSSPDLAAMAPPITLPGIPTPLPNSLTATDRAVQSTPPPKARSRSGMWGVAAMVAVAGGAVVAWRVVPQRHAPATDANAAAVVSTSVPLPVAPSPVASATSPAPSVAAAPSVAPTASMEVEPPAKSHVAKHAGATKPAARPAGKAAATTTSPPPATTAAPPPTPTSNPLML